MTHRPEFIPYNVFISHSHVSDGVLNKLQKELRFHYIDSFFDKTALGAGDRLLEQIVERIRRCDELIVVCTVEEREVKTSWWMGFEYGAARALEKKITVAFVDAKSEQRSGFMASATEQLDVWLCDQNSLREYLQQSSNRARDKVAKHYCKLRSSDCVRTVESIKGVAGRSGAENVKWVPSLNADLGKEAAIVKSNDDRLAFQLKSEDGRLNTENWWAVEWLVPVDSKVDAASS